MTGAATLRALLLAALPLASAGATAAPTSQPGPSELSSPVDVVTTASYAVGIVRDGEHVVEGTPVAISLSVHTLAGDLPMVATAEAFPGTDGDGQPVRVALQPAGRNRYTASVTFPAVGVWEFDVDAEALGDPPERAIFSIPVTSPHALPASLAWLIALLPLAGLALFARSEVVRLRTLGEESPPGDLPLARG